MDGIQRGPHDFWGDLERRQHDHPGYEYRHCYKCEARFLTGKLSTETECGQKDCGKEKEGATL